MGILTPIPAKGVDAAQFERFMDDLKAVLQWVTQETLGNAMGIRRSNLNRYLKGHLPITKAFLNKFYESWGHKVPPPDRDRYARLEEIISLLKLILTKIDQL